MSFVYRFGFLSGGIGTNNIWQWIACLWIYHSLMSEFSKRYMVSQVFILLPCKCCVYPKTLVLKHVFWCATKWT